MTDSILKLILFGETFFNKLNTKEAIRKNFFFTTSSTILHTHGKVLQFHHRDTNIIQFKDVKRKLCRADYSETIFL